MVKFMRCNGRYVAWIGRRGMSSSSFLQHRLWHSVISRFAVALTSFRAFELSFHYSVHKIEGSLMR